MLLVRLYANDFFHGFNAFNAKVAQGSNGIVLFPEPVNRFLYVAANFPFGATSTNPRRTNSANRKPKVLLLLWEWDEKTGVNSAATRESGNNGQQWATMDNKQ